MYQPALLEFCSGLSRSQKNKYVTKLKALAFSKFALLGVRKCPFELTAGAAPLWKGGDKNFGKEAFPRPC
jgi:hypothetical protein